MIDQLPLAPDVGEDWIWWIVLGWDGTPVDAMKVSAKQTKDLERGSDLVSWDEASMWGYLAARKYDSLCWLGHS